ncbi:MAG: hypothetical protein ACR2P2_01280 [Nakamurella sp.]
MEFPDALKRQLASLSAALDDPHIDLPTMLATLVIELTAAIPSFLGLTVSFPTLVGLMSMTTIDGTAPVPGASLLMPLSLTADRGDGSTMTFLAGNAGAFVDLAADIRWAHQLDGEVVLDRHLTADSDGGSPHLALQELSEINQAIGVLIGRRRTWDGALVELQRLAAVGDHSVHQAALTVLDDLS